MMTDNRTTELLPCPFCGGENRTTERYEVDGFEVAFVPWHSEYLNESFVAVYVYEDGNMIMHAGMTHMEPCKDNARKGVELIRALRGTQRKEVKQ